MVSATTSDPEQAAREQQRIADLKTVSGSWNYGTTARNALCLSHAADAEALLLKSKQLASDTEGLTQEEILMQLTFSRLLAEHSQAHALIALIAKP